MAYYCTDCSYRGTTSGQLGECPACGSFKISRTGDKGKKGDPHSKARLFLLFALWSYLLGLIAWKLYL
jgi:hypothetical protein